MNASMAAFHPIRPFEPCYDSTHIKCWTDWFDRDDPSGSGDWETLSLLRRRYPGKICDKPADIEVQTVSGIPLSQTRDVIDKSDTTTGFICRNSDQPLMGGRRRRRCRDYRVRFSCPLPFCGGRVCWTKWFNRDHPSGSGDWETLRSLRRENPGQICANPLFIEAVTVHTLRPAIYTRDNIYVYNPTEGFVCRNSDQRYGRCQNYQVRFACLC
ncbi:cartilage intermediate layer protein 2-like [Salarias fasciatus]|uniref:cartilage intermediate layer protein 2-like n=1 Tax=Salarias fasciatus TaxID=181472 RepID=UPI0011764E70|nr:cartilage intermediate layer protein 2-like [Salarias fasciatus]